jgi:CobQ-like glutamine amidotransferase family enzyme
MLRVVTVYPDLLGTYGDRGNGVVLHRRASLRGFEAEHVEARSDAPLPAADVYCIGGGEDGPQQLAVERLERDGTLRERVADGAVVLAVCAGLQVLGRSFAVVDGTRAEGLGLFALDTVASPGPRAVGEVVVTVEDESADLLLLTGFENHAGRTVRDADVAPLGRVVIGVGNGDGTDGAVRGRLIGTYLHGPVLARNPRFADWLLRIALDRDELASLEPDPSRGLHDERLAPATRRRAPLRRR